MIKPKYEVTENLTFCEVFLCQNLSYSKFLILSLKCLINSGCVLFADFDLKELVINRS